MRPRSITGPLILVVIGVLFLLNNLRIGLSPFALFGRYWPFLLIAAGVIGLVEVLISVGRGCETPPRPMGGGWIFWVVLWVVIIGIISDHGGFVVNDNNIRIRPFAFDGANVFGTGYDYDIPALDRPGAGVTRLVLDNIRGDISVKGRSDSADLHVTGRKTIRGFSHSDADRANRESALSFERQGDALVLKVAAPGNSGDLTVSTSLELTVPRSLALEVHSRSGDLSVENLDGSVDLSGARGDVRVNHIGGKVRVETTRGSLVRAADLKSDVDIEGRGSDVQLENVAGESTVHGEFSGTLEFHNLSKAVRFESERSQFHVEAIPGDVTIDLGDVKLNNVTGPVHYSSGSRDIEARDVTNALDLTLQRGDIRVIQSKAPLPKIDIHTHTGDISLALPDKAPFQLNATTARGDADNNYGTPLETRTANRGSSITGQTGPGPAITVATDRGSISVRKF